MAYTAAASARAWGRIEEPLQERICGMIDNCVSSLHFPEKGLTKTEIIEILMNDCIDTYGYNLDPKAAKVFRKIPKHCGVFLLENVILKT